MVFELGLGDPGHMFSPSLKLPPYGRIEMHI